MDEAEDQPTEPDAGRRRVTASAVRLVVAAAAVAVFVWWAWPSLSGDDDELDVLVVSDGFAPEARGPIEIHVRELGKSISWMRSGSDRCESAGRVVSAVEQRSPEVVILATPAGGDCLTEAVAGIDDVSRVAVVPAGTSDESASTMHGFHVVDPVELVGTTAPASMPCQWWEVCPPDGQVVVRDVAGSLTDIGHERLARAIVADL